MPQPRRKPPLHPLHPLRRIYEDADVLVVEKPAGVLTSSGPRDRRVTAQRIVERYLAADPAARPGLIHRLDKDASGLLVFSRNAAAYRHLKRRFFEHTVLRMYLAITRRPPNPPRGRIAIRLVERADGTVHCAQRRAAPGRDRGEMAVTDYAQVSASEGMAAVVVMLRTGRKHQIRAHLLARAGGIVNDPQYVAAKGAGGAAEGGRLMLANLVLGFAHPRGGRWMQFALAAPRGFPLVGGEIAEGLAQRAGMELGEASIARAEPSGFAAELDGGPDAGSDVGENHAHSHLDQC